MTRFARAKGSKASNERVPEEATSWSDIKQQISEKENQALDDIKRKQMEAVRQHNYQAFLEAESEKKTTQAWCEFPEDQTVKSTKKTLNKTKSAKVIKKEKPKKVVKRNYVSLLPSNSGTDDNDAAPDEAPVSKIDNMKMSKNKLKKQRAINNKPKIQIEKQNTDTAANAKDKVLYNKKGLPIKKKVAKIRDNKEHKSRKPDKGSEMIFSNGKNIEVMKFDGFPIMKDDHERLTELRKSMISKGIPKSEVKITMLRERRKAEKAFAREKKKVCFQCRKPGHVLSECPEIGHDAVGIQTSGSGMCFKCGSTEHTQFDCKVVRSQEFKFAECFICKEKGHIARQCPDNPRGLYPKGGGCRTCGSVTHLKKDCPEGQQEKEENTITLPTSATSIEGLENETKPLVKPLNTNQNVVKF